METFSAKTFGGNNSNDAQQVGNGNVVKSSALDLPKISGAAVGDKDSLITVVEEPEPEHEYSYSDHFEHFS